MFFLQTKYTYSRGQDHRKPYNENDTFENQVLASFESSLLHLQTDYLDSLVLHGPSGQNVISNEDKDCLAYDGITRRARKGPVFGCIKH